MMQELSLFEERRVPFGYINSALGALFKTGGFALKSSGEIVYNTGCYFVCNDEKPHFWYGELALGATKESEDFLLVFTYLDVSAKKLGDAMRAAPHLRDFDKTQITIVDVQYPYPFSKKEKIAWNNQKHNYLLVHQKDGKVEVNGFNEEEPLCLYIQQILDEQENTMTFDDQEHVMETTEEMKAAAGSRHKQLQAAKTLLEIDELLDSMDRGALQHHIQTYAPELQPSNGGRRKSIPGKRTALRHVYMERLGIAERPETLEAVVHTEKSGDMSVTIFPSSEEAEQYATQIKREALGKGYDPEHDSRDYFQLTGATVDVVTSPYHDTCPPPPNQAAQELLQEYGIGNLEKEDLNALRRLLEDKGVL